MKTIIIPASGELFNKETEEFFTLPETKIVIEHSLVSISKWESKWHKPYLSKEQKTSEQVLHYIKCMTITQNVNDSIYLAMPSSAINEIVEYIEDPATATIINDPKDNKLHNEIITSELVYYWMFKLGIPKECEKWHFNRLLTLIRVYGAKDNPKKMSKNEILNQNRSLNKLRRSQFKSKG